MNRESTTARHSVKGFPNGHRGYTEQARLHRSAGPAGLSLGQHGRVQALLEATSRVPEPARLHAALCAEDSALASRLLADGADPNARDPLTGDTPLQTAIDGAMTPDVRYRLVQELLARGADARRRNPAGNGPLVAALVQRDAMVLERLLLNGANPDHETAPGGDSLFRMAYRDYCSDTFGGRLPQQPDPSIRDNPERLVEFLGLLARRHARSRPDCLQLLLLFGTDG